MGSGSSVEKGSAASQPPGCPLFYNYSPNPLLVPASALPTRDVRGNVRRPHGGCAARIIALRHLPVVTPEAKKEAKDFFANLSKMKKAKQGDAAGLAKIAELEEQAKSIQQDPSLAPAVSSCFLVNIAVDEQGRLAPLSTDGPVGLADAANMADAIGEAETVETGSPSPASQPASGARRGFNFDAAAANPSSGQPSGGGTPPPQPANLNSSSRRLPQLNVVPAGAEAPGANAATGNMGALPSPIASRQPPQLSEAAVVQRLSQQSGGTGATGPGAAPGPLAGARMMPIVFAPPIATISDSDADGEDGDTSTHLGSSTRSLLIKDSRYRKGDGTEGTTPTTAAVAAGNTSDPNATRLRRQNSRIRLMQVPNKTRWFLFNDSRTHEAHLALFFCYAKSAESDKTGALAKDDRGESTAGTPGTGPTQHPIEAGALKMMCVPTPLSHTSTSPKEVKKQLANSSSSSRSFVEWEQSSVSAFLSALPTPTTDAQKEQLARFEAKASTMAAVCLFVVLAPGVTIFLAEGEATGYMLNTHMVPFNPSTSMAVLGRLLTRDMVLDSRRKAAGLVKDCYRHKLIYLSPIVEAQPAGAARTADVPEQRGTSPQSRPSAAILGTPGAGNGTANPRNNNSVSEHLSSHSKTSPLPPIQQAAAPLAPKPYSSMLVAAAEPMNAAGDAAAPSGQPQQRLSRRSPSTSPTGAAHRDDAATHRKRIGSMLRHPSLADGATVEEEDGDQSFHRDLPSTNSLAISF